MCGRYALFTDTENQEIRDIIEEVGRKTTDMKLGEIFPTDHAPVLIEKQGAIVPELLIWGYPNFHNKGVIINARAETVQEKPMFRKSLFTKRGVIPSTGFYEWTHSGKKTKYQFNLLGTSALYMAGLYNEFEWQLRYVILTTEANHSMAEVHNRMPVVMDRERMNQWLKESDAIQPILVGEQPQLVRF